MLPDTTSLALFINAVDLGSISKAAEVDRKHTSELQSRSDLVCRLLLEKKNF